MALAKITQVTGRGVFVPGNDIDTDRIIPARFMKCVTFDGLGEFLFYDMRKNADGSDQPHPLNEARFKGARILLSGTNFGCGSSREHAPQAIQKHGFRAVVAESFAEIFFGNCTANGIPCVCVSHDDAKKLGDAVTTGPALPVTVDLIAKKVQCGGSSVACTMQEGARQSLVAGNWDFLGQLVEAGPQIRQTAGRLPYMKNFA